MYADIYWKYNPVERVVSAADGQPKLGYRFTVPVAERLAGITYVGHAARLRLVLERARNGETLRIGALGGSITAGHGVGGGEFVYLQHFMDWMNAAMPPRSDPQGSDPLSGRALRASGGGGSGGAGLRWPLQQRRRRRALLSRPPRHTFLNGAVPGTQSGYTSSCLANHLIPDPDLVFVEFAVNDSPTSDWGDEETPRRPLERLFRKLLRLPSQPAVVLVNMYATGLARGVYWHSAERDFMEFATYYGLPSVSLKASVMPASGAAADEAVSLPVIFTGGHNHPGRGGHVVITEALITLCLDLLQLDTIRMAGATAAAAAAGGGVAGGGGASGGAISAMEEDLPTVAARPLPPPIFPGNLGAATDTCYIEEQLPSLVQQPVEGWEWTDEGRNKWGYVARAPGRTLRMKVSTLVGGGGADGSQQAPIILQIAYLQSYCGLGTARLNCSSGCACNPVVLDAFNPRQVSLATMAHIKVTQHSECLLEVTTEKPSKLSIRAAMNATNATACLIGGGGAAPAAAGAGAVGGVAGFGWGGARGAVRAPYKFKVTGLVVGEDPGASEGTVTFVRGNSADILKRVQAFARAHGASGRDGSAGAGAGGGATGADTAAGGGA